MGNILITGIAGFIGFHVANKLQDLGHTVIGIDNFNAYYSPILKNQRAALLQEKATLYRQDLLDEKALLTTLQKHKITHVIHLAAQAGVRHSLEDPKSYTQANIEGFRALLEAIRHYRPIPCIYASSSSVYGTNTKTPFKETDPTDHPANLYGATKKANELMAYAYHHLFQIPLIGLRYFTVYGPLGRPDMAYFSFAKAILEERPLQIFNEGKMRRDFTYIDDIVDGTIAATFSNLSFEIFNLGNHTPIPLLTFLNTLEEALEKKAILEMHPMQPGDMVETFADIEKAQKLLHFSPKTPLKEGLTHFASWFQKRPLP